MASLSTSFPDLGIPLNDAETLEDRIKLLLGDAERARAEERALLHRITELKERLEVGRTPALNETAPPAPASCVYNSSGPDADHAVCLHATPGYLSDDGK